MPPFTQRRSSKNRRTIAEINAKIKNGDIQVRTAEEMKEEVESSGHEIAFKEVDVVTTGTFGAMCSSGAVINLGHADPPIKIHKAWMNDVEVCHPGAAVDLLIGATCISESQSFEYGGGHVIEDLVRGKEVDLCATAYATDCYPRTSLSTTLTKDDLNQFFLLNFRNCYQRYVCATNSSDRPLFTYMGKLLPQLRNASYSGAGALNPLMNDPDYETIGIGTRIFLGGGIGYVIGEGTQHDPKNRFGTLMVKGNCMKMDARYIRGASLQNYGCSLYVGLGVPIPILNENLARKTGIRDEEIVTDIIDYSIPRRSRPRIGKVTYKDLRSGSITIGDKKVRTSSMSSFKMAREITEKLKTQIETGFFFLTSPIERISTNTIVRPIKQAERRKSTSNGYYEMQLDLQNSIDEEKCIDCGACYSICPTGAIAISQDYSIRLNSAKCLGTRCGKCIDNCPVNAINLKTFDRRTVESSRLQRKHPLEGF